MRIIMAKVITVAMIIEIFCFVNQIARSPRNPGEIISHCQSSTGEGETPYCFAFEGIVRVEILARGVEIRMSHEVLNRDDIAAFFKK